MTDTDSDAREELIQVVRTGARAGGTGLDRWEPTVGQETLSLLQNMHLPDD